MTSHWAFWPQVPGQGSLHLFLIQALSRGHSGLSTHSGLQASYGLPVYSGIHSHKPFWQFAFGPHGDGLQGSVAIGDGVAENNDKKVKQVFYAHAKLI